MRGLKINTSMAISIRLYYYPNERIDLANHPKKVIGIK